MPQKENGVDGLVNSSKPFTRRTRRRNTRTEDYTRQADPHTRYMEPHTHQEEPHSHQGKLRTRKPNPHTPQTEPHTQGTYSRNQVTDTHAQSTTPNTQAEATLTTYENQSLGMRTLDNLLRNVAVVGALLLTIVALRNIGDPQAQSVFSAIQAGTNMEWDESLGKLSFVSNLIPESVQAVWGEGRAISVMAPCYGEITHVWSRTEPYLEILSNMADIRAVANGEIMSVAHGPGEEIIIRLRHDDDTESLYGNLAVCYMDVGEYVFQGDIIATVLPEKPLAFELRHDGRSIDPKGKLRSLTD